MQKVYLLLRNNKQSGPFSFDELVQQGLKPADLIWIEGKSTGWSYPSEIDELQSYMPAADAAGRQQKDNNTVPQTPSASSPLRTASAPAAKRPASEKVFVSLPAKANRQPLPAQPPSPADELEKKAEELRQRAQMYAVKKEQQPAHHVAAEIKYGSTLDEAEADYTLWSHDRKTKKKKTVNKNSLAAVVVLTVVLAAGYVAIKFFSGTTTNTTALPAEQYSSKKEFPETETDYTQPESTTEAIQPLSVPASPDNINQQAVIQASGKKPAPASTQPSAKSNASSEETIPVVTAENNTTPTGKQDAQTDKNEENNEATAAKEKKKTLGEKLNRFFERLEGKQREEPATKETPGTPPASGTTERKAARRGESNAAAEPVNLAEQIDITSNKPAENWMMGVHGLKITLHNRSDNRIEKAAVEVRYYNEQNSVLETKTVYFTNIAPKKSVTVAAPDHRLADHTDHRLLSVSGKEAYARQ